METKTGFFEETAGVKSFIRLSSFILLIFFIIANLLMLGAIIKALLHGCELPKIDENFLWFDTILLVFVFFPKVAQKLIEVKFNVPTTTDTTTVTASVTQEKTTNGSGNTQVN